MTPARSPWAADEARALLGDLDEPAPVLLALQVVQDRFGYIPAEAVPLVADVLNVSRADVHGVLTFYRDLRVTPPPRTLVRVCMGEACQAVGARLLLGQAHALVESGGAPGDTEVERVFCLGNCALGPAMTVDGTLLGRVDEGLLRAALSPDEDGA